MNNSVSKQRSQLNILFLTHNYQFNHQLVIIGIIRPEMFLVKKLLIFFKMIHARLFYLDIYLIIEKKSLHQFDLLVFIHRYFMRLIYITRSLF